MKLFFTQILLWISLAYDFSQVLMLGQEPGSAPGDIQACETKVSSLEPTDNAGSYLLISGQTKSRHILSKFNSSITGCNELFAPFVFRFQEGVATGEVPSLGVQWLREFSQGGRFIYADAPIVQSPIKYNAHLQHQNPSQLADNLVFVILEARVVDSEYSHAIVALDKDTGKFNKPGTDSDLPVKLLGRRIPELHQLSFRWSREGGDASDHRQYSLIYVSESQTQFEIVRIDFWSKSVLEAANSPRVASTGISPSQFWTNFTAECLHYNQQIWAGGGVVVTRSITSANTMPALVHIGLDITKNRLFQIEAVVPSYYEPATDYNLKVEQITSTSILPNPIFFALLQVRTSSGQLRPRNDLLIIKWHSQSIDIQNCGSRFLMMRVIVSNRDKYIKVHGFNFIMSQYYISIGMTFYDTPEEAERAEITATSETYEIRDATTFYHTSCLTATAVTYSTVYKFKLHDQFGRQKGVSDPANVGTIIRYFNSNPGNGVPLISSEQSRRIKLINRNTFNVATNDVNPTYNSDSPVALVYRFFYNTGSTVEAIPGSSISKFNHQMQAYSEPIIGTSPLPYLEQHAQIQTFNCQYSQASRPSSCIEVNDTCSFIVRANESSIALSPLISLVSADNEAQCKISTYFASLDPLQLVPILAPMVTVTADGDEQVKVEVARTDLQDSGLSGLDNLGGVDIPDLPAQLPLSFFLIGKVPDLELYEPAYAEPVQALLTDCGSEEVSWSKNTHVIGWAKESSLATVQWTYTTKATLDWQTLSAMDPFFKLPYATVTEGKEACGVYWIKAYRDSNLTEPVLPGAVDSTLTGFEVMNNGTTSPQIQFQIAREDFGSSLLYFEAMTLGGATSTTAVRFGVCGEESLNITSPYSYSSRQWPNNPDFVIGWWSFTSKVSVLDPSNNKIHHCPVTNLTLHSNKDCSDPLDNEDVQETFSDTTLSQRVMRIKTAKAPRTEEMFIKVRTAGRVSTCEPLTIDIKCGLIRLLSDIEGLALEGEAVLRLDLAGLQFEMVTQDCPISQVTMKVRLEEFLNTKEYPSGELQESQVQTISQSSYASALTCITLLTSSELVLNTADCGEGVFTGLVLEFQQASGNAAYVDLLLNLKKPPEPTVSPEQTKEQTEQFHIPMTDMTEDKPIQPTAEPVVPIPPSRQPDEPQQQQDPFVLEMEKEKKEEEQYIQEVEETYEEDYPVEDDDGAVVLQPWTPPWASYASKQEVNSLFSDLRAELPELPPVEPEPLKISIGRISRDGQIAIDFNQNVKVPRFGRRRQLLAMDELNVGRDLFDVSFKLHSEQKLTDLKYSLQVDSWTEREMKIRIEFGQPELISQGEFSDKLQIAVKSPQYFISAESGNALKPENAKVSDSTPFPRQLPKGVIETEVKKEASKASGSLTSILIIQIILQVLLKGSIDDLWSFFLLLQIIAFMSIYETPTPAEIDIFIAEFRKIVKFEVLSPDGLLQLIDPQLSMEMLMNLEPQTLTASLEASGVKSPSMLVNLGVYIVATLVFLVLVGILLLIRLFSKLRPKITSILIKIRDKMFWNNLIRSVTISYLETAISLHTLIFTLSGASPFGDWLQCFFLTAFVLGYPATCLAVLLKNFKRLDELEVKARIGRMYSDISLKKETKSILFYPVFMIRRLSFVLIPTLFRGRPYFQLQALIFTSALYTKFLGYVRPHLFRQAANMEVLNEAMFVVLSYHFLTFSLFNAHVSTKAFMGKIYLIWIGILVSCNMAILAYNTYKKHQRRLDLNRLRSAWQMQKEGEAILGQLELEYQAMRRANLKPTKIKTAISEMKSQISSAEEQVASLTTKPFISKPLPVIREAEESDEGDMFELTKPAQFSTPRLRKEDSATTAQGYESSSSKSPMLDLNLESFLEDSSDASFISSKSQQASRQRKKKNTKLQYSQFRVQSEIDRRREKKKYQKRL